MERKPEVPASNRDEAHFRIFLDQGLNPCLLHCGQILYPWVGPGKPNLPLGLRGKAGGCARVTAGPKRPHPGLCLGPNVPLKGLLCIWWNVRGTHLELKQEPQCSSPFLTQIAESLQSWDRRVRPRLVWRNGTPLDSCVVHGVTGH